ncbi:ABC transporter ATP-binding protein [Paenibacillus sp. FSL K6-3166]|uniref:ABC transporter ATP-binding protein n=1 Tax=unclassified Paenibacillus TaxID=185978 RepID=UPI000BA18F52|nr:ABC transporter ATP-binding protein [Paenibacillus sp. VTT E-133291]
MNIIQLKGVHQEYQSGPIPEVILENITKSFAAGKVYAVMGPSGSGKTTLLNIIGGILRPVSGEVWLDGENLVKLSEKKLGQLRLNKVGYIFQSFNLLPFLTVEENIFLPIRLVKKDVKPYLKRYTSLLKSLGIEGKKDVYIHELSGGQQQRVAIARCLLMQPKVILADEPTGNLDSTNGDQFMNLLTAMAREHQITVILVTHDEHIASFADEIIDMKDGCITTNSIRGDKGNENIRRANL